MSDAFGVVIACCSVDAHYAAGCVASVRFFMPEVPVCILYDGEDVPVYFRDDEGLHLLTRDNVQSQALRERSFGPGVTKMVALFESPFETFLYLDADTTVCGDLREIADFQDYDLIVDRRGWADDDAINSWFFDPVAVSRYFPGFDWAGHRADYFCTGTFFARRNALRMERYLELLDFVDAHPNVFKFWEMGLLNYMIFEAQDQNRCRVFGVPYQFVTRDHPAPVLEKIFKTCLRQEPIEGSPSVFHYPVTKPHLGQNGSYTLPMSYYRREFWRRRISPAFLCEAWLMWEDVRFFHLREMRHRVIMSLRAIYIKSGLRGLVKRA